jgi:hypothetical protein
MDPFMPPVKAFLPLAHESRVKFGEPFERKMKPGVIVDALVIGLARFLAALRPGCRQRASTE